MGNYEKDLCDVITQLISEQRTQTRALGEACGRFYALLGNVGNLICESEEAELNDKIGIITAHLHDPIQRRLFVKKICEIYQLLEEL